MHCKHFPGHSALTNASSQALASTASQTALSGSPQRSRVCVEVVVDVVTLMQPPHFSGHVSVTNFWLQSSCDASVQVVGSSDVHAETHRPHFCGHNSWINEVVSSHAPSSACRHDSLSSIAHSGGRNCVVVVVVLLVVVAVAVVVDVRVVVNVCVRVVVVVLVTVIDVRVLVVLDDRVVVVVDTVLVVVVDTVLVVVDTVLVVVVVEAVLVETVMVVVETVVVVADIDVVVIVVKDTDVVDVGVVVVVFGHPPSPGTQCVAPTHALPNLFVGVITL